MKDYVVMVAGGTGTRMRLATAKQFLNVEGLPLMWWTLRRSGSPARGRGHLGLTREFV